MNKLFILATLLSYALSTCPGDEYCAACQINNTCAVCVNSYADTTGKCVKGDDSIKNCYIFATSTTCLTCNNGYYVVAGKCIEIDIDNCWGVDSNDTTKCTTCNNGKIPLNGACDDGADCNLSNCKYCTSATQCVWCDNKYSLTVTGTCVSDPVDNCLVANDATCFMCERGFYVETSGCEKTGVQGSVAKLSVLIAMLLGVKILM